MYAPGFLYTHKVATEGRRRAQGAIGNSNESSRSGAGVVAPPPDRRGLSSAAAGRSSEPKDHREAGLHGRDFEKDRGGGGGGGGDFKGGAADYGDRRHHDPRLWGEGYDRGGGSAAGGSGHASGRSFSEPSPAPTPQGQQQQRQGQQQSRGSQQSRESHESVSRSSGARSSRRRDDGGDGGGGGGGSGGGDGGGSQAALEVSVPVAGSWRLSEKKELGSGSFGQVFLGLNTATGEMIAVKRLQVWAPRTPRARSRTTAPFPRLCAFSRKTPQVVLCGMIPFEGADGPDRRPRDGRGARRVRGGQRRQVERGEEVEVDLMARYL
jgi:hypothetical protein